MSQRHAIGRILIAVVIIVVVALGGLGFVLYQVTAVKPNTVTLGLDFTPNSGDAPLFYGVAQGYYKQNAVNLSIIPGTSFSATLAALEAGKLDFALTAPTTITDYIAKNNVSNIKIVATEYAYNGLAVVYNNASISSIQDLNGKAGSMASPTSGDIVGDFKLFAQANNLNYSSMNIQFNPVPTSDDLLLAGKVQFIVVAIQNLDQIQSSAAEQGINLGYFLLQNHGVPESGVVIAALDSYVQQQPTIVGNFVKATMESLVFAYSNRTGAVEDLVKAEPQLVYNATLAGYNTLLATTSINPSNLTSTLQYGWISPQLMQQTVNTEIIADNLNITLNATTIYTNQFVQQP